MAERHPLVVVAARPEAPGIVAEVAEPRESHLEERRHRIRAGTGVTRDELQVRPVPFRGKIHYVIESLVFRRRPDEGCLVEILDELRLNTQRTFAVRPIGVFLGSASKARLSHRALWASQGQ